MTFLNHLHQAAVDALSSIPASQAPEIYAVSFLIDNTDDDPRLPTLLIGYNTETQMRQAISAGRASDPAEACWNYAFWLQNQLTAIGDPAHDPDGAAAREQWIRHLGLWYDEPADDANWLTVVGPLAQQIEAHFNTACTHLARTLHTTGVITATFGRPVPILVHELEYYEQIAVQTESANPPGVADPFTSWIRQG
jgi:ABC-type molybdate transport system substrate-binding protein